MTPYIYIIALAIHIADNSAWRKKIGNRWKRAFNKSRFRPFDCAYCLGFWLTFLYLCYTNVSNFTFYSMVEYFTQGLVVAIISGLTSSVIKKVVV